MITRRSRNMISRSPLGAARLQAIDARLICALAAQMIRAAARSAIMTVGICVFADGMSGMIDASMTINMSRGAAAWDTRHP
jgi:hypothetical protein